jgi:glycosyltransferase involved in cell wall biosynthesis
VSEPPRSGALVSVVVPAYNAGRTLDETLRSVRGQTHTELEIIVVDDGSTDDTAAVAQRHADADPRLRVIRQRNAGVAAARNTGWQAAKGDIVALIDSDDLWAAEKIERQLRALEQGGPDTGFVYCFFVRIDAQGIMSEPAKAEPYCGHVLDQILEDNFVGNGSSMLVRREIIARCDGFDTSLHAAGAQGCDDYLFCCRAAEICDFAVVPDFLVGYRDMPGSVSASVKKMLRSWILSADQMLARRPDKRSHILQGVRRYAEWLSCNAVYRRRWRQLQEILAVMARHHPRIALQITTSYLPNLAISIARSKKHRWMLKRRGEPVHAPAPRQRFQIGEIRLMQITG